MPTMKIRHTVCRQPPNCRGDGNEAMLHRLYGNVTIFCNGFLFMSLIGIDASRGVWTTPVMPMRKDSEGVLPLALRLQKPEWNPHVRLCFNDGSLPGVLVEVLDLPEFDDWFVVADRRRNSIQSDLEGVVLIEHHLAIYQSRPDSRPCI